MSDPSLPGNDPGQPLPGGWLRPTVCGHAPKRPGLVVLDDPKRRKGNVLWRNADDSVKTRTIPPSPEELTGSVFVSNVRRLVLRLRGTASQRAKGQATMLAIQDYARSIGWPERGTGKFSARQQISRKFKDQSRSTVDRALKNLQK